MKKLDFVEGISRLIQAAEDASVSRDELHSVLSQLHEYSEELQKCSAINVQLNKKIKILDGQIEEAFNENVQSQKIISTLKDQLCAQEQLVGKLLNNLVQSS